MILINLSIFSLVVLIITLFTFFLRLTYYPKNTAIFLSNFALSSIDANKSKTDDSSDDSDQDVKIDDRFNDDDWYVGKRFKRSTILALVYLARLSITNTDHQPHKNKVWPTIQRVKWQKPEYFKKSELGDWDWAKIRDIVKAMWRKYKDEDNHDLFENFFEQASAVYTFFKRI